MIASLTPELRYQLEIFVLYKVNEIMIIYKKDSIEPVLHGWTKIEDNI